MSACRIQVFSPQAKAAIMQSLFAPVLMAYLLGLPPHDNWAQWRGPLATGVGPNANPPVNWSENKNIRWKVAVPGKGHSTPVIWGDRIFLTTAIPFGEPVKPRFVRPGAH